MADLEIRGIEKSYKKQKVLTGADLSADKGQCVGILGKNGSGKSTLLQILAGILSPDAGSCRLFGHDLFSLKSSSRRVGYVPQGAPFYEELSARDNLRLYYGKEDLERSLKDGFLKRLGVDGFIDRRVSKLSGGMKKRLSIGCSLSGSPRLLLLDEPSSALDLICKEELQEFFREYVRDGGMILLVTHEVDEIALCDVVYVLKDGKLVLCEGKTDLKSIVENIK